MAALDEFADGLAEIRGEVPQSFTWSGETYDCFASGATKGGKLESYGFAVNEDLVIVVEIAEFGANGPFPEKEQTLQFNGRSFRIDHALRAPGATFIRLACVNASRGV